MAGVKFWLLFSKFETVQLCANKMSSSSFKSLLNKMWLQIIFEMYKEVLVLNKLQWLIYHKTQSN